MTFIAVAGFSYAFSNPAVQATVAILDPASTKVLLESKGVHKDGLRFQITNITVPSAGATIPDAGPYTATFVATSLKVKADGTIVLVVGDKTNTINATPQIPGSPNSPYPVSFYVYITAAGQSSGRGN